MENASTGFKGLSGPELEYFLLARLERFASCLAEQHTQEIPAWHTLARHATAVAYRDCLTFGLADEAAVILREARDQAASSS
jgi:hypothetical protein